MAKRSITDEEIGLIKSMLVRGMANKDIQFYFNRQDRPVNSGRITGIKVGSYGPEAPRADDASLTAFLANFKAPGLASPVMAGPSLASALTDPMNEVVLRSFFAKDGDGKWRCIVGESDEYECKEGFSLSHSLKTIAGFANNRGGYLFYGVRDKPDGYGVCGLADDKFAHMDPSQINLKIRSSLEPTPRFQVSAIALGSLTVGVLRIESHPAKPVIASRNDGDLKEGDILFRYPGETKRIRYADLRGLLDDRDRQSRMDVLPAIQSYLTLGPRDAMVVNLAEGRLENGERPIIIDQALVDRIKFIRDGEFNEREGAETLRLIGDVTAVASMDAGLTKIVRKEVTEESIIRNFVERVAVEDPLSFVRQASHEQSHLLPVFYYLHLAGLSRGQAVADLQAYPNRKPHTARKIIERLTNQQNLFVPAGGKRKDCLEQVRTAVVGPFTDISHVRAVMDALTGVGAEDMPHFEYINGLLLTALESWTANATLRGCLRKAASRLDELIYGPLVR